MSKQLEQLSKLKYSHNIKFVTIDAPFIVNKMFIIDPNVHKHIKGNNTTWNSSQVSESNDKK